MFCCACSIQYYSPIQVSFTKVIIITNGMLICTLEVHSDATIIVYNNVYNNSGDIFYLALLTQLTASNQ